MMVSRLKFWLRQGGIAAAVALSSFSPNAVAAGICAEIRAYFELPEYSLDRLALFYRDFRFNDPGENQRFIDVMQSGQARHFVTIENSVLKRLNDQLFGNRATSEVINLHFQAILHRHLQALGPAFTKARLATYTDYKMIRIALSHDDATLIEGIERAYQKTVRAFAQSLEDYSEVMTKIARADGILRSPAWWFRMGTGRTLAGATQAARAGRRDFDPQRAVPTVRRYDTPETLGELFQGFANLERLRRDIQTAASKENLSLLLHQGDGLPAGSSQVGHATTLNELALRLVAKSNSAADFQERVRETLGVSLSAAVAKTIYEYHAQLDFFMPHIYVTEFDRIVLPLDGALIWFDVANQGVRNKQAVSLALGRQLGALKSWDVPELDAASRQRVDDWLEAAREAQSEASREFAERLDAIEDAIHAAGLKGDTRFSVRNGFKAEGDEGAFVAKGSDISRAEFHQVLRHLHASGFTEYRLVKPTTPNMGEIKLMEQLEKSLRLEIARGYGAQDLPKVERLTIGLYAQRAGSERVVHAYVVGDAPSDVSARMGQVLRGLLPAGWRMGEMITP